MQTNNRKGSKLFSLMGKITATGVSRERREGMDRVLQSGEFFTKLPGVAVDLQQSVDAAECRCSRVQMNRVQGSRVCVLGNFYEKGREPEPLEMSVPEESCQMLKDHT